MSPYRRAGTAEDVLSRSMMRNQAADRRPMGKHQCDLAGQLTLWCSPAPAPSGGASALKPRTPRTDHAFLSGATALATPPTEDATCVLISAHPLCVDSVARAIYRSDEYYYGVASASQPHKKYWLRREVIGAVYILYV